MTSASRPADLAALPNEELLRRRGDLGYAAQMAALEGLPVDEADASECRALEAELLRRGLDPHAGHAPPLPRR